MNTPRRRPPKQPAPIARWLPAIAAVSVLVVVVLAGAVGGNDSGGIASGAAAGAPVGSVDSATSTSLLNDSSTGYDITGMTVPVSTLPVIDTTATVPVVKTAFASTIYYGSAGDDVKQMQQRLTDLGFAPGGVDGFFGEQTKEAVWAYEKLMLKIDRADVDGLARVDNAMWQVMQDPVRVVPRRPGPGTHVEIYLPEQVAAVFTDDKATLVIHISSGAALTSEINPENSWCETITLDTDENGQPLDPPVTKAVCGVSYTPGGVFRFRWKVTGKRVGPLGGMYNPIYFNFGIAMHGAKEVPLEPASHGCIRMNETISNTFQDYVHIRDVVYVWGQDGKEPEQYSKKQSTPIFNYPDPNAVTTTTEKVATTTATTVADKAPTTTAKPSTSTPATTPTTTPHTTPTPTTAKPAPVVTTPPTSPPATSPPVTSPPDTSPPITLKP
jgi:peptidoglycan hydrolase-like protein with peptidoglycan-binding domain